MNSYGNNYGCHTPFDTERVYGILEEAGLNVQDLSWHNDEGDSLKVNNNCNVWIPNPKVYSHYGYVPYKTVWMDDDGEAYADEYDWDKERIFETEHELVNFLLKTYNKCITS